MSHARFPLSLLLIAFALCAIPIAGRASLPPAGDKPEAGPALPPDSVVLARGGRGGGGFRGGGGMRGGGFRGGGSFGRGSRDIRSSSVSNINRNADRNTNRDRVQNPIADRGNGFQGGWDNRPHVEHPIANVPHVDHPIAAGAVIGAAVATAAAVGSVWNYLPADCGSMYVNTLWYYQCGEIWYQPQYEGDAVQYEVVEDPR